MIFHGLFVFNQILDFCLCGKIVLAERSVESRKVKNIKRNAGNLSKPSKELFTLQKLLITFLSHASLQRLIITTLLVVRDIICRTLTRAPK